MLGRGVLLGLVAPPLLVVVVIALAVLVAIGLKLWAESGPSRSGCRSVRRRSMGAAALAAIAAMAQVIGLLFAVIALVGLVVLFFAPGRRPRLTAS